MIPFQFPDCGDYRGRCSCRSLRTDWNSATASAEEPTAPHREVLNRKSSGFLRTALQSNRLLTPSHPPPRFTSTVAFQISDLRLLYPNGSLVFPPFSSDRYRHEVHAAVYRCRLRSPLGILISREVHVKAGKEALPYSHSEIIYFTSFYCFHCRLILITVSFCFSKKTASTSACLLILTKRKKRTSQLPSTSLLRSGCVLITGHVFRYCHARHFP